MTVLILERSQIEEGAVWRVRADVGDEVSFFFFFFFTFIVFLPSSFSIAFLFFVPYFTFNYVGARAGICFVKI